MKNIIIVVLGLGVLVLGGLYLSSRTKTTYEKPVTTADTSTKAATSDTSVAPKSAVSDCATTLATQLKADNTDYEKGTVLVTFAPTVAFSDAKTLVVKHSYSIQDEANTSVNFSNIHRFVAVVPEGKELEAVCTLRAETNVKYAGVNELFDLHQ